MATAKGADDVTTIGTERPDSSTGGAVILGVDTQLDFHVGVALDHLGRRLGELSVPATVQSYERLLRWAEGFGPREVCRSRRYQLLRDRTHPPPEGEGDRSA